MTESVKFRLLVFIVYKLRQIFMYRRLCVSSHTPSQIQRRFLFIVIKNSLSTRCHAVVLLLAHRRSGIHSPGFLNERFLNSLLENFASSCRDVSSTSLHLSKFAKLLPGIFQSDIKQDGRLFPFLLKKATYPA